MKQEVVLDVDVDVGGDHAQRLRLEDYLGARLLDQEVLGYLPEGGLGIHDPAESWSSLRDTHGTAIMHKVYGALGGSGRDRYEG